MVVTLPAAVVVLGSGNALRLWRESSCDGHLAHHYHASWKALLWDCYGQVLGHAVTFRSSPTVFADTRMPGSACTRFLTRKPPRAIWRVSFGLPHSPLHEFRLTQDDIWIWHLSS